MPCSGRSVASIEDWEVALMGIDHIWLASADLEWQVVPVREILQEREGAECGMVGDGVVDGVASCGRNRLVVLIGGQLRWLERQAGTGWKCSANRMPWSEGERLVQVSGGAVVVMGGQLRWWQCP